MPISITIKPEFEFNEFEPRLKSAKNRFQLSAGLNLETLNTILSGTNYIWAASQFNPRLKFFKRPLNELTLQVLNLDELTRMN